METVRISLLNVFVKVKIDGKVNTVTSQFAKKDACMDHVDILNNVCKCSTRLSSKFQAFRKLKFLNYHTRTNNGRS